MEFIDDRGNVPTLKKSQINECKKVQLTFSEQVKILLDRKNMTVSSLADALGVSRQNLSNRLKTNNFDTDWMQKIADALGTKIIVKFD
ncbi:MAG: helix-turn-helix transcriptional regulator [Clostridium sulfidigenes]|uniref:Helix-turn-helix transcriptional regulator n=1 Tax=Clostridium sulfidigenes TaxID=318464 RepID=A0A927ZQY6_9CLOT|nr:helix-turn-helix transcriptional regulator [Clostridium sulfidigenes]